MIIAIPVANDKLCMHFGHCDVFKFYEVDKENKTIVKSTNMEPPPHEPGVLPKWIAEQGASLVLAGGIGHRAKQLLAAGGVDVISGVTEPVPDKAIRDYMDGNLAAGTNACNH
ncbi:MAG: ATPase [Acidobacteria bacterium]|nr:MAG: ATPase [Acidobacteriota bacterium]